MTAYEEQIESIRRSAAFFGAIDEAAHDRPVPACPGWTVGDVVRHVAWQGPPGWIAMMNGADGSAAVSSAVADRAPVDSMLIALADHLAAHAPTDPCPTYFGAGDFGYWAAHGSVEVALHRCDVAAALGQSADLAAGESRAGLVWSRAVLPSMASYTSADPIAPLAIIPTDADPVQLGVGVPRASVSGPAAALVFWLWGRDRGGVEVTGDAAVAATWSSISGRSFQHEAIG